ncbi:DUF2486 family protein [Burkholderia alba]|uniref:DUF2486 family protein n=1 Tax=Burkholderia alba TaxID=2683677 RepID=UPI002B060400|nr:DUF2486 family protein [Burkholderia alba]
MLEANASSIPVLTDTLTQGQSLPTLPVLTDVLVPGKPALARAGEAPVDAWAQAVPTPDVPAVELPTAFVAPTTFADELPASHPAPDSVAQPALQSATVDAAVTDADAQRIADRLRSQVTRYLTGEGRGLIEARCRDALQDHSTWLVSQITREVALALETEVTRWVKDALDDELARRAAHAPGGHSAV